MTTPPIPSDTDGQVVLEFPQVFEIEMPLKSGLGFLDEGETVAQKCEVVDVNNLVVQGHRVAETIPEGFFPPYT